MRKIPLRDQRKNDEDALNSSKKVCVSLYPSVQFYWCFATSIHDTAVCFVQLLSHDLSQFSIFWCLFSCFLEAAFYMFLEKKWTFIKTTVREELLSREDKTRNFLEINLSTLCLPFIKLTLRCKYLMKSGKLCSKRKLLEKREREMKHISRLFSLAKLWAHTVCVRSAAIWTLKI